MAKQTNHSPPVWIEFLYVGANNDYSQEMVISSCVSEKDTQREITKIYRNLTENKFENMVYSNRMVVKKPTSNFNKVSVIPSTRELVYVYMSYTDNGIPKQISRLVRVSDLQQYIVYNIQAMNKNPNWKYQSHTIKQYCDSDRLQKILQLHFKSKPS